MARLYTVIPLALLCYGMAVAMGGRTLQAFAAALAIACAVAGGYAYNDLRDQAADRVNRPRRPVASGLVAVREVRRLVAVLFAAAALLAVSTRSAATIGFIILLIIASRSYSDFIKPIAGLKNAFVGFWSGLLPWSAALDYVPLTTLLPAALIVGLFVTQKELLADVYDREGDAAQGVNTIPVLFGPRVGLGLVVALNLSSLLVARAVTSAPVLVHVAAAGEIVATVNVLSLCFVFLKVTSVTVRVALELQKAFQIGGCLILFAVIST